MDHAVRVQRLLANLDQPLLVTSLVNVRYLTGFTGSTAFVMATPDGCTLLTDGRYAEVAGALTDALPSMTLSIYKSGLYDRIVDLFGGATSVGLESAHITWEAHQAISSRYSGELVATSGVVERLRLSKDVEEVEALRSAAIAGDHAFSIIDSLVAEAENEAHLGELMVAAMEARGGRRADWAPIVAGGANASRPHHESETDALTDGLLLLDYGCVVDGYHSDMTRTVWRGPGSDEETENVYAAVLASNEEGIATVKPGVPAADVDSACRAVLEDYGYLEYFLHSTGHGVGLEIHEAPGVRKDSTEVLEPGQVVTVEPGVYLQGRLGVRIEDMVLVTAEGSEVLTRSSKEIRPA